MAETNLIVKLDGGPLTVKLFANNYIAAKTAFGLYNLTSNAQIEAWNLIVGNSYVLQTPFNQLPNTQITFQFQYCSTVPAITDGIVEIQFLQDNVTCPITAPTKWVLSNIPDCNNGVPGSKDAWVDIILK